MVTFEQGGEQQHQFAPASSFDSQNNNNTAAVTAGTTHSSGLTTEPSTQQQQLQQLDNNNNHHHHPTKEHSCPEVSSLAESSATAATLVMEEETTLPDDHDQEYHHHEDDHSSNHHHHHEDHHLDFAGEEDDDDDMMMMMMEDDETPVDHSPQQQQLQEQQQQQFQMPQQHQFQQQQQQQQQQQFPMDGAADMEMHEEEEEDNSSNSDFDLDDVDLDLDDVDFEDVEDMEDDDDEEDSKQHNLELPRRRRSIIKPYSASDVFVNSSNSAWKSLPKPENIHNNNRLPAARAMSVPVTRMEQATAVIASNTNKTTRVSFSTIQVRGYDQTIGDHPGVSIGPPIGLDWEYQEFGNFDVDQFEATRGPRRKLRHMCLNYYQRIGLLTNVLGVSTHEIQEAERVVAKIKQQRAMTKALLPTQKLQEVMQSAKRKAARSKFFTKK